MPSHEFYTTPTLRLVVGPTASVDADVLVIPVFTGTDPSGLDLPDDLTQGVAGLRGTQELKGDLYEQHWLRADGLAAASRTTRVTMSLQSSSSRGKAASGCWSR